MAEDRFARLEHPRQISRSEYPKIQRVAHYLRNRVAFARYYCPRMVSLGPIHHGEPHLQEGEQYKLMWASMYVKGERERAQHLHRKIQDNIEVLKGLYTDDAIRDLNEEELTWMLFVDGCALLQILKHPDILNAGPLNIKVDQLAIVRQDALLLENQLPFRVLQLLSNDTVASLRKTIHDFLDCHHLSQNKPIGENQGIDVLPSPARLLHVLRLLQFRPCHHFSLNRPDQNLPEGESSHVAIDVPRPPPAHLLDELRRKVLFAFHPPAINQIKNDMPTYDMPTYRNLQELKAAGIEVKKRSSECPIDITFSSYCFSGKLNLPVMIVDDTTAPTYLNLMAYEVCPDFENNYEISSYVELLDSLIDQPDDVKELRRAEVLHNGLGSDEEVANLFNVISTDLVPNDAIYASLRAEIEKHYKKRYKTWLALAFNTYFSNPWSIIAFIAASVALVLTLIQTWFAAFPRGDK